MDKLRRRLEDLGRRWPALGTALHVQKRFGELNGSYLASGVTLAGFLSLFPLLLVGIAVVGFVSRAGTEIANGVIEQLGLTGTAAQTVRQMILRAEDSRKAASIIGFAGLVWSGLGLVGALQYAVNTSWQMTGRGWKDKLRGMAWLAGAAVGFLASFGVSAALNFLPGWLAPLGIAIGLVINFGLWLWTLKTLANVEVGWRALVPGAVLGAVGLEALKLLGSLYLPRAVRSASALYGPLGVVFAILAWLLFFGRLLVYSNILNVVRWEQEHGTRSVALDVPAAPPGSAREATRAGEVPLAPTSP